MSQERITRRLDDLLRIGAEASYLVKKGKPAYLANTMDGALLRDAGERILIKVATVAEKLPDDYKAARPDVDWTGISRMRNLVAHHCGLINGDLLWQALAARIPKLLKRQGIDGGG